MVTKTTTNQLNQTTPAEKEPVEPVEKDTTEPTKSEPVQNQVGTQKPIYQSNGSVIDTDTTPVAKAPKKTEGASEALVKALNNYVKAMNPVNPISIQDGVREQKRLRGAVINAVAEGTDEQAVKNVQYILDFINADTTGCFDLTAVFRFYDSTEWKVPAERKEMETLMTLFTATAKQATRGKEARRLDWEAMAKHIMPLRSNVVMGRLRRVYGID
jgi:hypothetical protein